MFPSVNATTKVATTAMEITAPELRALLSLEPTLEEKVGTQHIMHVCVETANVNCFCLLFFLLYSVLHLFCQP